MKNSVNKVYLLTMTELTVIAAAKNIQGLFGLHTQENNIGKDEVCYAMNDLYIKEFILNAAEEEFVLEEGLRSLMDSMAEAKKCILIRQFIHDMNMKTIYLGKKLVAFEQRESDVNQVRIYEIPREELQDFLVLDQPEQEPEYRNVLDEERLLSEGLQNKKILDNDSLISMGNVMAVIERLSLPNHAVSSRMIVKCNNQRYAYEKETKSIVSLEEKDFYERIVKMIEEGSHDIS